MPATLGHVVTNLLQVAPHTLRCYRFVLCRTAAVLLILTHNASREGHMMNRHHYFFHLEEPLLCPSLASLLLLDGCRISR